MKERNAVDAVTFRGAAEAPHESERRRGPAGWTREEIDAWVECRGLSPRGGLELAQLLRRALVRLCPEAPDYDALVHRLKADVPEFSSDAFWTPDGAAAADSVAALEFCVAALWHQSLSEPVEGEATA